MTTISQLNNGTVDTGYAVGTIVNSNGTVSQKKSNSEMGNDTFLKLLVAQLKYQNPLSPTDSTQFMQQSAQFSMLEALQDMQKSIASQNTSQSSSTALGLVGKKVTASAANGGDDIVGVVTSVKLGTDGPVLKIGDMEVAMSQVKEVTAP